MRSNFQVIIFSLFLMTSCATTFGQKSNVDQLSVSFSDPSMPGFVKVSLVNGGIMVNGYNGKEVMVEAEIRFKSLFDEDHDNEKSKGMKRIQMTTTGLTVEEEDNVMTISTESWKRTIDLKIKVPTKTSLKLSCVNSGDIIVENVEGEFEINNVNGAVTLRDISGAVVAHALNKDLVVNFKDVTPKKSMSFSSLNGDLDVSFPKDFKADLKLKSDNGDIYSDFDVSKQEQNRKIIEENKRKEGGKYRIRMDDAIQIKINGGGSDVMFKTFNGDIYIRKAK